MRMLFCLTIVFCLIGCASEREPVRTEGVASVDSLDAQKVYALVTIKDYSGMSHFFIKSTLQNAINQYYREQNKSYKSISAE